MASSSSSLKHHLSTSTEHDLFIGTKKKNKKKNKYFILDIKDNNPLIELLKNKDYDINHRDIRKRLKKTIDSIIQILIHNNIQKNQRIFIEMNYDFIFIDTDYQDLRTVLHNPDLIFDEDDTKIERITRTKKSLKTCQIKMNDFKDMMNEDDKYFFLFLVNRHEMPFKLLFLGYYNNEKKEDEQMGHPTIFIQDLIRSKTSKLKNCIVVHNKKSEHKGKYGNKILIY